MAVTYQNPRRSSCLREIASLLLEWKCYYPILLQKLQKNRIRTRSNAMTTLMSVFIKCILFEIYFFTKKDLDIFWKGYFLIPNQSFFFLLFLTFSFQETKGTIISFLLNILTLAKCKSSCYVLMKMKYVDH